MKHICISTTDYIWRTMNFVRYSMTNDRLRQLQTSHVLFLFHRSLCRYNYRMVMRYLFHIYTASFSCPNIESLCLICGEMTDRSLSTMVERRRFVDVYWISISTFLFSDRFQLLPCHERRRCFSQIRTSIRLSIVYRHRSSVQHFISSIWLIDLNQELSSVRSFHRQLRRRYHQSDSIARHRS